MQIRLKTPHLILDDAVAICNKILADPDSLSLIFLALAKQFCDDAESSSAISTERLVGAILNPGRVITVCRNQDRNRDYIMMAIPEVDIIIINKQELPDPENCDCHPEQSDKHLVILLMSLLRECSHLFTKSFNELANNHNNTAEEKKNDTPETIGRATINNETENDCGAGLEINLFGGIMFYDDGVLTITVVENCNMDIEDEENSKVYEIPNEVSQMVAQSLRSWYSSGSPSVADIFPMLHFSQLPLYVKPMKKAILHGIRTKFYGHVHKILEFDSHHEEHLPEGLVRRKLLPTKIPGYKK